jgi:hypothetical protein
MQQDPSSPEPRPLDYRPASADGRAGADTSIYALKTFIAFVLSGGLFSAVMLSTIVIPLAFKGHPDWAMAVGANLTVVLALSAAALALRRRPRYRGYAAGIWLGLGAAALLHGLCFLR